MNWNLHIQAWSIYEYESEWLEYYVDFSILFPCDTEISIVLQIFGIIFEGRIQDVQMGEWGGLGRLLLGLILKHYKTGENIIVDLFFGGGGVGVPAVPPSGSATVFY